MRVNSGCADAGVGSLLRMAVCENCGGSLEPQWKFCIHCGTRVMPAGALPDLPAAIRPEDAAPPRKRVLDWQLGLGIAFAVIGAAMIVYLVVVLVVPHGG